MTSPRDLARDLFGMTEPVARGKYLLTGWVLMLVKFVVDAGIAFVATGKFLSPWRYLSPVASLRFDDLPLPDWAVFVMVVWAIPFLWIGLAMSLRRTVDAGIDPRWALWFLVPVGNLILIAWLSLAPSRSQLSHDAHAEWSAVSEVAEVNVKLVALMTGISISVGLVAFSTLALDGQYGAELFVGTPALIGFVTGWHANRPKRRSLTYTLKLCTSVIVLSALAVMLFALEGVICIVMALPLAIAAAWIGGALGRAFGSRLPPAAVVSTLVALPLLMGATAAAPSPAPLRSVRSEVRIDAPPEVVWRHVIGFPPLPEPSELIFSAGIAYPVRAEIRGSGVGAVRHCVFSTGPFVEPITAWEPPSRLAFDVTAQPPGMTETSPYAHVYAPHLDEYPKSERGEFRLERQHDGTTLLVGTTWYRIAMFPQAYWGPLADAGIHAIHVRVLGHIERTSEAARR